MVGRALRRGVQLFLKKTPSVESVLRYVPKYFPFEGLGFGPEDFMKLYNKHEEHLGHDPLDFFMDKKTLLKAQRNMGVLEDIGMSPDERKAMVLGTCRMLEATPLALSQQISFYRKKLKFTDSELREYFLANPNVLHESIENHVSPRVSVYKALGFKQAQLRRMVLLFPELLRLKLDNNLVPAMRALAKCDLTLVQAMSAVRNFPHLVGMPHDMIKAAIRLMQSHRIDNEEIVAIYKKAARVRLDTTGKYGDQVRWFAVRLKLGVKLGVLVVKEGIACGFRFHKEDVKRLLESKGFDWEPIWEALDAQRKARQKGGSKDSIQTSEGRNDISHRSIAGHLASQLVQLEANGAERSASGGIVDPCGAEQNDEATGVDQEKEDKSGGLVSMGSDGVTSDEPGTEDVPGKKVSQFDREQVLGEGEKGISHMDSGLDASDYGSVEDPDSDVLCLQDGSVEQDRAVGGRRSEAPEKFLDNDCRSENIHETDVCNGNKNGTSLGVILTILYQCHTLMNSASILFSKQ